MTSVITRHISSTSITSSAGGQLETSVLIPLLSKHKEALELGCEKIFEKYRRDNASGPAVCVEPASTGGSTAVPAPINWQMDAKARENLANHLVELLAAVSLPELPQNLADVDTRITNGIPGIPSKLMPSDQELEECRVIAERGRKKQLNLPFDKIFSAYKDFNARSNFNVCLYIVAIMEHIIANFLQTAVCYEKVLHKTVIHGPTIETLFSIYRERITSRRRTLVDHTTEQQLPPQDYDQCVDRLRTFLNVSLEQMNLILRVFREPVNMTFPKTADLHTIFGCIIDLYNNMRNLLEDIDTVSEGSVQPPIAPPPNTGGAGPGGVSTGTLMPGTSTAPSCAPPGQLRLVGNCLVEPAEDDLLDAFAQFGATVLNPNCRARSWALSENVAILDALGKSSRIILQAAAGAKVTCGNPGTANVASPAPGSVSTSLSLATSTPAGAATGPLPQSAVCSRCRRCELAMSGGGEELSPASGAGGTPTGPSSDAHFFHHHLFPSQQPSSMQSQLQQHHMQLTAKDQLLGTAASPLLCNYLVNAFKYLLPRILLLPIFHFFYLLELIETLRDRAYVPEDRVAFVDAVSILSKTRTTLERRLELHSHVLGELPRLVATGYLAGCRPQLGNLSPSVPRPPPLPTTRQKLEEIEKLTGGKLQQVDRPYQPGEFVMEGKLLVRSENKRLIERVVFLFTGALYICKWQDRRPALTPSNAPQLVLRIKKRLCLDAIHVIDVHPLVCPSPGSALQLPPSPPFSTASSISTINLSSGLAGSLLSIGEDVQDMSIGPSVGSNITLSSLSGGSIMSGQGGSSTCASSLSVPISGAGGAGSGPPYLFELEYAEYKSPTAPPQVQSVMFGVRTPEEKADWMASLLDIQTHRLFDKYLRVLPKLEVPLRLPPPDKYRFAEADSPDNIVFEEGNGELVYEATEADPDPCYTEEDEDEDMINEVNSGPGGCGACGVGSCAAGCSEVTVGGVADSLSAANTSSPGYGISGGVANVASAPIPVIRWATLTKLVERITYPAYLDTRGLSSFLLAYRRFSTPSELLDLLVERFSVPDPEFTEEERRVDRQGLESRAQHMLKRFKTVYKRRVQLRVIQVLTRWVRHSRYYRTDFASDPALRDRLATFLAGIQSRDLRSGVRAIERWLSTGAGTGSMGCVPMVTHSTTADLTAILPPPILDVGWAREWKGVRLTNVHPVELSRQITLYEWDLYRQIQYWELEGKEKASQATPNLDRSKEFSNRLRNWLVLSVLLEPHPEDRVVVMQRVADLMQIMDHFNNLQGAQEAKGALISAAVFRLKRTYNSLRRCRHYRGVFESIRREAKDPRQGSSGLYTQAYSRRIQAIEEASPPVPCVPFVAFGVTTKLIHTELRHPDTMQPAGGGGPALINFRKHRWLSQIVERYLAFQRLQYNFRVDPVIREFLQRLDPCAMAGVQNEMEFERFVFQLSEQYEPRASDSGAGDSSLVSGAAIESERRLNKMEIRVADQLTNMPLKDKLNEATRQVVYGRRKSPRSLSPPITRTPVQQHLPIAGGVSPLPGQTQGVSPRRCGAGFGIGDSGAIYSPPPSEPTSPSGIVTGKHHYSMSDSQVDSGGLPFPDQQATPRPPLPPLPPRLTRTGVQEPSPASARVPTPPPLPPKSYARSTPSIVINTTSRRTNSESSGGGLSPSAPPPPPPPPPLPPRAAGTRRRFISSGTGSETQTQGGAN